MNPEAFTLCFSHNQEDETPFRMRVQVVLLEAFLKFAENVNTFLWK